MFRLMPFDASRSALIGGFDVHIRTESETLLLVYQGQSPRLCLWCHVHVHVMSCIKDDELILYEEGCWMRTPSLLMETWDL